MFITLVTLALKAFFTVMWLMLVLFAVSSIGHAVLVIVVFGSFMAPERLAWTCRFWLALLLIANGVYYTDHYAPWHFNQTSERSAPSPKDNKSVKAPVSRPLISTPKIEDDGELMCHQLPASPPPPQRELSLCVDRKLVCE